MIDPIEPQECFRFLLLIVVLQASQELFKVFLSHFFESKFLQKEIICNAVQGITSISLSNLPHFLTVHHSNVSSSVAFREQYTFVFSQSVR